MNMAINEITKLIEETVTSEVFGVWFLIGAALVFFMQAGFAMVETGFTRAKNAGNIIMKNLMDFCIGTVVFVLLGFGLMTAWIPRFRRFRSHPFGWWDHSPYRRDHGWPSSRQICKR